MIVSRTFFYSDKIVNTGVKGRKKEMDIFFSLQTVLGFRQSLFLLKLTEKADRTIWISTVESPVCSVILTLEAVVPQENVFFLIQSPWYL